MYTLEFTNQAIDDLRLLKRSEPTAYKKVQKLLAELMENPRIGTGKPEMKKYDLAGLYYIPGGSVKSIASSTRSRMKS